MIDTALLWGAWETIPTARALCLKPNEIDALAQRRLAHLLGEACRSTLHRRRLREAGVVTDSTALERDPRGVLRALMPLSKRELREAGADALAGGVVRPEWRSSTSSGSTGEPFTVHFDPRAWAVLKFLVKLRARYACGLRPHHRVAILDAAATDPKPTPLERAGRVRRISVLQPPDAIARALDAFCPEVIYGVPSALLETADALCRTQCNVVARHIFTGGELLQAGVRRSLEAAFTGSVHDVYGTSETKEIAWECARGGLHVNADVMWVEVLDAGDEPADAGAEGDIVVTVLVNQAMPLVRYRTGDRGTLLPHPCDCGLALPLLGVVTGRESDTLEIAGGQRVSPYALTCALEAVEGLRRYQIRQLDRTRLRVHALPAASSDRERIATGIRAALRARIDPALGVEVEFVDRFASGPQAKFRVVEPLAPPSAPGSAEQRDA